MNQSVKDQILEQIECLAESQQRRVLQFTRSLSGEQRPKGTPGKELVHHAGTIELHDLELMEAAIEEGCERIDPHGW